MYIFVEGSSDKIFLENLFLYHNIKAIIEITGGKGNLKNMPKLEKYSDPVIIFDADNDYNAAKNNIINQINNININISPCIYLFPDNENTGTLENLLMEISYYPQIHNCFNSYKQCISNLVNINNQNFKGVNPKSQLFAYLEAFGFKHINSNREIVYENIFDFNHEKVLKLINFLNSIS